MRHTAQSWCTASTFTFARPTAWTIRTSIIPSPDAPSLIVLDKTTGRLVAQDGERMAPRTIHCTWSSPGLGVVGGRPLIFFGGGDGVCYAFDSPPRARRPLRRSTLRRVWRFDCDPAAPKENIHRWQENRKEGPSNITGMPVFYQGRVYVTAGGDYWHGKHQAWLKCIDASRTGDITHGGEVWSFALQRHCLSTPSICNGLVYIVDCGPSVHCLDAKTGREYWSHRIKGDVWGSTLVADGKVYVGTQRGLVLRLCRRQGEAADQHHRTRQSHERLPRGRQWRLVRGHHATALCDRQALNLDHASDLTEVSC